jgi:hypothetical protein
MAKLSVPFRTMVTFVTVVVLLSLTFVVGTVEAVTYINGDEVRETRRLDLRDSPFHVRGDIDVMEGGNLVIEPGVKLQFEPGVGITVRGGRLIAEVST